MIQPEVLSIRELKSLIGNDTFERLENYVQLLRKWRRITNLISEDSFGEVWGRHILDAVYLQRQRPTARSWLDVGSGAGLPSVVIASILAGHPAARVHCVEIDRRKCAFLREVATKLALPMKVHNTLAEAIAPLLASDVEVCTARAFSSLDSILSLFEPYMKKGAAAVLPRGRSTHEEVARLDHFLYSVKVTTNPTPGDGVFVHIELRDSRAS